MWKGKNNDTCSSKKLIISLLLLLIAITFLGVVPVSADVPVVKAISPWKRQIDDHTFLNLTITHNNYFSGHFVYKIQVSIDGNVRDFTIEAALPVDQTRTSTFVVPIDLGVINGTPTVQAMAYCTLHGPSNWSNTVKIPEFPAVLIVLVTAFLMVLVIPNCKNVRKQH